MTQKLPASQVFYKKEKDNAEIERPFLAINTREFTHFFVLPLGAAHVLIVKNGEKSSVLLL